MGFFINFILSFFSRDSSICDKTFFQTLEYSGSTVSFTEHFQHNFIFNDINDQIHTEQFQPETFCDWKHGYLILYGQRYDNTWSVHTTWS